MDVKKIALIIGAMIVALGAAFGVNTMMRGSATPEVRANAAPEADGPKIMVATRALPVGTILTADAVRMQAWPKDLVKPEDYFVEGQTNQGGLVGSVVRVAMTAGAPLTKGALVNPGDRGFLAAALGPGMRAVTIPMAGAGGVAGFVFPGDRVDLMLTQGVTVGDKKFNATETILQNLRVLAVDQRSTPTDANGASTPAQFGTVTVEVTPRIAEKLAVAQALGTLSLALRSIADNAAELDAAIASGAVSVAGNGSTPDGMHLLGRGAVRPSDRGVTLTTGGDVSRFARRSVPLDTVASNNAPSGNSSSAPVYVGGPNAAAAAPAAPVYRGPTVRIVRGDQVTIIPVGGN